MLRSIRVKLVTLFILLILFSMQLIGAYFVRSLTSSLIRSATQTVQNQAQLLATIAAPSMGNKDQAASDVNSILSSLPQFLNGTVYLLNAQGVVVETSAGPALIGQKRVDTVVTQCFVGHRTATAIRYDEVSRQHLLAVAVPMQNQHETIGVAEYVVPIQSTYDTVRQVTTIFYTGSALVLLLAAVLGVFLSRAITRPVLDVTRQARIMASGNFTERVEVRSNDEFGDLASAINDLTEKLEDAIASNNRERERLQAVIKYMGDGVIMLSVNGQPLLVNDAATRILQNDGRTFERISKTVLLPGGKAGNVPEENVSVHEFGDALVHVHVTPIVRKRDEVEGYVAVLRDVTGQERLHRARQDFVANVSHELRTPLTSISTYLEALQEDQGEDQVTRRKFLEVIRQQTDRMIRITQDLLQLSGLDEKAGRLEQISVFDVDGWLTDTVHRFALQANRQQVTLTLITTVHREIRNNRDMLDRVLDNVLGNALHYTPSGGSIKVTGSLYKGQVKIQVSDTGIGIPKQDLPHVFERFYRVDKARSRRRGGTGLGLALAKEITDWSGGTISIDSEVNQGTVVTIILPVTEGDGR